jgi:hypothetical protein
VPFDLSDALDELKRRATLRFRSIPFEEVIPQI